MKKVLTPGRLYSILASEFRMVSCERCASCSLPLTFPVMTPDEGEPTWVMGELSRQCQDCTKEIAKIVRRNQRLYDLMDPISTPIRMPRRAPRPPPVSPYH